MALCWACRKNDAVAAQAVKGPSVKGVRLGAGAGNDLLEWLDLLLPCEVERGLASIDMSTGYRCSRRQSAAIGALEVIYSVCRTRQHQGGTALRGREKKKK